MVHMSNDQLMLFNAMIGEWDLPHNTHRRLCIQRKDAVDSKHTVQHKCRHVFSVQYDYF